MIDWGLGRYERTAAELEPVARDVVDRARLRAGERVLDLACGTGNAALAAARAGTTATGLDAAARLIEVARARAAAEGFGAAFVVGDAQALPFDDDAFDAVLSVFGIIFAPDAEQAFAETLRVLRPDGRALLTAWVPEGPIDAMVGVLMRAVAQVAGAPSRRFAWHDAEAVGAMAARHGARVSLEEGEISFVGESPESYFADSEASHPMSVASRPLLERAGSYEATRAQAIEALRAGNEDPGGFRVTSRYRVIRVEPAAA